MTFNSIEIRAFLFHLKKNLYVNLASILAFSFSIAALLVIESTYKEISLFTKRFVDGKEVYSLIIREKSTNQHVTLSENSYKYINNLSFDTIKGVYALNLTKVDIESQNKSVQSIAEVIDFNIWGAKYKKGSVILSESLRQKLSSYSSKPLVGGVVKINDAFLTISAIVPDDSLNLTNNKLVGLWIDRAYIESAKKIPKNLYPNKNFHFNDTITLVTGIEDYNGATNEMKWLKQILISKEITTEDSTIDLITGVSSNYLEFVKYNKLLKVSYVSAFIMLLLSFVTFLNLRFNYVAIELDNFVLRRSLGASKFQILTLLLKQNIVVGIAILIASTIFAFLLKVTINYYLSSISFSLPSNYLIAIIILCIFLVFVSLLQWSYLNFYTADYSRKSYGFSNFVQKAVFGIFSIILCISLHFAVKNTNVFIKFQTTELGFIVNNLLSVKLNSPSSGSAVLVSNRDMSVFDNIVSQVENNSNINIAYSSAQHLEGSESNEIKIHIPSSNESNFIPFIKTQYVSKNFFDVLEIPFKAGRGFNVGEGNVAVVNELFVEEYFRGEDPLLKSVYQEVFDMEISNSSSKIMKRRLVKYRVIGVIPNLLQEGKGFKAKPEIYFPTFSELLIRNVMLKYSQSEIDEKEIHSILDELSLSSRYSNHSSLEEKLNRELEPEFFKLTLIIFASISSLIIFAIILHNGLKLKASRKIHEIHTMFCIGGSKVDIYKNFCKVEFFVMNCAFVLAVIIDVIFFSERVNGDWFVVFISLNLMFYIISNAVYQEINSIEKTIKRFS